MKRKLVGRMAGLAVLGIAFWLYSCGRLLAGEYGPSFSGIYAGIGLSLFFFGHGFAMLWLLTVCNSKQIATSTMWVMGGCLLAESVLLVDEWRFQNRIAQQPPASGQVVIVDHIWPFEGYQMAYASDRGYWKND